MKKILILILLAYSFNINGQGLSNVFKFATFYSAVNGGTSISDQNVYSITDGLQTDVTKTPFDYTYTIGLRKIARFGYENRANTFYNGTENSWSDAATLGKVSGFEFLLEADYRRQQGINYLDQNHFLRYVGKKWVAKLEYLQDGFADIQYLEASERYRHSLGKKFSLNIGMAQRLAEPYGYNPLNEWLLSNGNLHYTYLAIEEMGYSIDVSNQIYTNPYGNVVANSVEVWEEVVIPAILNEYVAGKRNELNRRLEYSLVLGFDFYHYDKDFWLHSWGNLMPYHIDTKDEFSYHSYNNDDQWVDYSGGLIFGYKFNKNLGIFVEGKYNKYWNRTWHDFSFGFNYVIF